MFYTLLAGERLPVGRKERKNRQMPVRYVYEDNVER